MAWHKATIIEIGKNQKGKWTCKVRMENGKEANFKPGKKLPEDWQGQEIEVFLDNNNSIAKAWKQDQGEFFNREGLNSTNQQNRQNQQGRRRDHPNNHTENPAPTPLEGALLPQDTRALGHVNSDNLYLFYHKWVKADRNSKFSLKDSGKDGQKMNEILIQSRTKISMDALIKEYHEAVQNLPGIETTVYKARLSYAMAMGLGDASVYETSWTLHHTYGVPVIRASAIKGLVRSYVIQSFFMKEEFNGNPNDEDRAEKEALQDEGFCELFGSPKESKKGEYQGELVFFDALPHSGTKVGLDIMTPHYSPYYQKEKTKKDTLKPAGDYYDPVPVTFPVVTQGSFTFVIGVKKTRPAYQDMIAAGALSQGHYSGKSKLEIGHMLLEAALKEFGLGAKTALGYGVFQAHA